MIGSLPSMHEALGSILNTKKEKTKKINKKYPHAPSSNERRH
jgi:hypothetical protein